MSTRHSAKGEVKYYTLYERLWHWLQAMTIVVLLASGFHISYGSQSFPGLFATSVWIHDLAGWVLVVNAALALFHNLSSGLIKQYIPMMHGIFPHSVQHASYYLFGIFQGEKHPFHKTPQQRLLPLQQISYFFVLNLLLPIMVVTGLLQMYAGEFSGLVSLLGGLELIAPLHRFVAWLFAGFVVLHIYMTTTGTTWYANLRAMLTGYGKPEGEEPEAQEPEAQEKQL
ncbi:MAG: cytochrome B [Planctomycetota bacterium]|nr:MAG: cytochrome B [Planctomycetota bacterium]